MPNVVDAMRLKSPGAILSSRERSSHGAPLKARLSMMWWYGYPGAGMAAWMIVSSVTWLAIVGVAVWAFVRWVSAHTGSTQASAPHPFTTGPASPSVDKILRQRFARGEIDGQMFEQMQAQLHASSTHDPRQATLTNGSRVL
jgi:uncharacterized membrane protein